VLITAQAKGSNRYKYKLYSNLEQIRFPDKWLDNASLKTNLEELSKQLKRFDHRYVYQGDKSLESIFRWKASGPACSRP